MRRRTALRCLAYRVAGYTAVALFAWPFYAIDRAFEWLADVVTVLCAIAASPSVTFYDWCVKRHNAIRRAALEEEGK